MEDAYKELHSKLPNIAPTGRVTKRSILRSASRHMSFVAEQLWQAQNHGRMRDMVRPPPHTTNHDSEVRPSQIGHWGGMGDPGEGTQDRGGGTVWPLVTHDEVEVQIPDGWSQAKDDNRETQVPGWTPNMPVLRPPVPNAAVHGQNHDLPQSHLRMPRPPRLLLNPQLWRQHQSVLQRQPQTQSQPWPWPVSRTWPIETWPIPSPGSTEVLRQATETTTGMFSHHRSQQGTIVASTVRPIDHPVCRVA